MEKSDSKFFIMLACFVFSFLIFVPSESQGKLIDVLISEYNFDLRIKELESLQKEAQYNYSDEYANYKLDMVELQKEREDLIESLKSEQNRREIEEKGLGIQFQLKFYSNLIKSLYNLAYRTDYLLMLKDLRFDVLRTLPAYTEKNNLQLQSSIKEDQVAIDKYDAERKDLLAKVKKLSSGRDVKDLPKEVMEEIRELYEKNEELARDIKQRRSSIARNERQIEVNKKSLQAIKAIEPQMMAVFDNLQKKRNRLIAQVDRLARDVKGFNVSITASELLSKVKASWTEVSTISTDLDSFVDDYSELSRIQESMQVSQVKRESISLESIVNDSSSETVVRSTDSEITQWLESIN